MAPPITGPRMHKTINQCQNYTRGSKAPFVGAWPIAEGGP